MGGRVVPNIKLIAVNLVVVCSLLVVTESVSFDGNLDIIPFEGSENVRSTSRRFISMILKRSAANRYSEKSSLESQSRARRDDDEALARARRDDEVQRTKQDELREEYERRLFESLNIVGTVEATRLYVPEYIQDSDTTTGSPKAFNIEVGTVVGKVRKLFPHGKQLIVWPYAGWRNFTVDENTGEIRTTAKMDFELIWLYDMTIRDFKHNYSDPEPLRQPPMPDPLPTPDPKTDYVDHYLIIEVVDRNDNVPKFIRDTTGGGLFTGQVNTNARAGTPILYIHAEDDDSGPRGRIRFNIKTDDGKQSDFTIDPKTHFLKTAGDKKLPSGDYKVYVEALDYGKPPKSSGFQEFSVSVRQKLQPEFFGIPYNFNFSEANVCGSLVATVEATSRSGMPIKYEILTANVKNTFAINHLGQITLLRKLDYDTGNSSDKMFTFDVRATEDAYVGRSTDTVVNLKLVNADNHLGMFKMPAKQLQFEEGSFRAGGHIYKVDVEDCDCKENCECKTGEMIYKIGDTEGFFDITSGGQIRNIKDLDYEKRNYFFFPVQVIDPGRNGRTRTSYVEITILDVDDTPPNFPTSNYDFAIFEDAPKNQVIGAAQALDPDPSTKPDDITYSITNANPQEGRQYFTVGNLGVITVLKNTNQFNGFDTYEFTITAIDKGNHRSDPPATVKIRVLDVNDHQPVLKECREQSIKEKQPIGTVLTTLTATDEDRGVNKLIEYSLATVQKQNVFKINNQTGVVSTTAVLDREQYDEIFVVAKATDGGADRSELLRQVGYCQFIVKVEDVNDHHPMFTVQTFKVNVLRTLAIGETLLQVEAVDPDLGDNAKIEYTILTQKIGARNVVFLEVVKATGAVKVKTSMAGLNMDDEIVLVIQGTNKIPVVGSVLGPQSKTTVRVKFSRTAPPAAQLKYTGTGRENQNAGLVVFKLPITGTNLVFSLQTIRDRGNLPFNIGSTSGEIKTTKPLDFELKNSYLFAVTVHEQGLTGSTSIIVQINVVDIVDVVPIFGNDNYYEATVSEAAAGGVNVFRVQASDPDPISGDKIIYRIEPKLDYKTFAVSDMTNFAQIKTWPGLKVGNFDREKKDVYTIVIEAYRQSSPSLRSVVILVIHVRDENDCPPIFTKTDYKAADIPENIPVPYIVPNLILNATDQDILENGDVYYFITSGNDGRFTMETIVGQDRKNTGRLIVSRPLDAKKSPEFEKNPVYTLTVTATDRKHTATATVTVRIQDRPDSKPEFLEPYYEKYLLENAGPGLPVVQVKVRKPEDPQDVIRYKLDEKAIRYFEINEETGMIKTAGDPLDWEITPVITFPVYAYERRSPNITGQTFVRVVINDVNDASPVFPDQPYVGYIKENMPAGTLVRCNNGIDRDNPDVNDGKNVKLTYELLTNTGEDPFDKDGKLFTFDSSGRLETRVRLDAEEFRRNLSIRIRAWDDGNPRLWGETDVTIVIRDENEFPAWFRKRNYEATVSESRPPGYVVLQLTTKDRDFAPPNNYAFSLKSGNYPYAFDINQETGEIVVSGVLDIEKTDKKVYTLTVGLKERNDELLIPDAVGLQKAFEDTATVKITITEGNDNRPTFTKSDKTYEITIPEDTPVGTKLNLGIVATDDDVGFSNKFRFAITSGNVGDWFGVAKPSNDSNRADVIIQYPLDREFKEVYQMQLVVIDNGGVSDTAWLRITLTDKNDNAPRFLPPHYSVTILEGTCDADTPLATITVVDDDEPDQGPFKIEFAPNGNPGTRFQLRNPTHNTSQLYCSGIIDREATPDLKVVIKATDNPPQKDYPKLSSTVNVFVHVLGRDDVSSPTNSARMRDVSYTVIFHFMCFILFPILSNLNYY